MEETIFNQGAEVFDDDLGIKISGRQIHPFRISETYSNMINTKSNTENKITRKDLIEESFFSESSESDCYSLSGKKNCQLGEN